MIETDATRRSFATSDGVSLSYLEAGRGQPLIMIPGWSQTALQWHHQIAEFAQTHHVFALDMRGHGQSDRPDYGYRIHRLAQDVREFMLAHDLTDAIVMGHSMGCSVIWALYDLHGPDRIAKLILVDQSAYLSDNPTLSPEDRVTAGAIFTPEATFDTALALSADHGDVTAGFVGGMFSPDAPREMVDEVVALNMDFPRAHAATLVVDHIHNDWRDVIRRIAVPTLCVGGRVSLVPWQTMEWQASVIPDAALRIFEPDEGGAHFMFMENPEGFNAAVSAFLGSG